MILKGKKVAIFNVANKKSIAWAIAQSIMEQHGEVILGYQNERLKENLEELTEGISPRPILLECDVSTDKQIETAKKNVEEKVGKIDGLVHSIAYAPSEALKGKYLEIPREAFRIALEISVYSFVAMSRIFSDIINPGGSIITLTYFGSEKVIPNYNVMGVAKSALESSVRYLAYELGQNGIRVNAVSPGPLSTLAARGISGFVDMLKLHRERAPLRRNIEHREVGNTVAFLVSDLASGITGEVIYVDAGYNIMGM